MTIIAASIPILRVIVRDVQSTARKYYVTDGETRQGTNTNRQSKMRSQNNTVIVTAQRSRIQSQKQDDWSDKSVTELAGKPIPGQIMQINEVAVEYQDRKDTESIEYEMDYVQPR